MDSIGVFFNDADFDQYPFTDPAYKSAYTDLGAIFLQKHTEFFILRNPKTYEGDNTFSSGWRYTQSGFEAMEGPITVDLIYNKGSHLMPDPAANIVNKLEFDMLCRNKMKTYELFPALFPRTSLARTQEEAVQAIDALPSSIAVLKPQDGWGGKNIWIGPKTEAAQHLSSFPVIVQEFIDSSGGLPGFPNLRHDFRITVANGKPFFTYLRIPAEGKFVANIAQGGRPIVVPPHLRPPEPMAFVKMIDAHFTQFGNRLYSIDCARDVSGAWKLIELNDQPGIMPREDCFEYADQYFEDLSEFLIFCAQHPTPVKKREYFCV